MTIPSSCTSPLCAPDGPVGCLHPAHDGYADAGEERERARRESASASASARGGAARGEVAPGDRPLNARPAIPPGFSFLPPRGTGGWGAVCAPAARPAAAGPPPLAPRQPPRSATLARGWACLKKKTRRCCNSLAGTRARTSARIAYPRIFEVAHAPLFFFLFRFARRLVLVTRGSAAASGFNAHRVVLDTGFGGVGVWAPIEERVVPWYKSTVSNAIENESRNPNMAEFCPPPSHRPLHDDAGGFVWRLREL